MTVKETAGRFNVIRYGLWLGTEYANKRFDRLNYSKIVLISFLTLMPFLFSRKFVASNRIQ